MTRKVTYQLLLLSFHLSNITITLTVCLYDKVAADYCYSVLFASLPKTTDFCLVLHIELSIMIPFVNWKCKLPLQNVHQRLNGRNISNDSYQLSNIGCCSQFLVNVFCFQGILSFPQGILLEEAKTTKIFSHIFQASHQLTDREAQIK